MEKIDLTKFCSKDGSRFNIHEPFSKGKWTYATDGHIIIRVPEILHIPQKKGAPDCEQVFLDADKRGPYHWRPVPEVGVLTVQCDTCSGSGKAGDIDPCDECDGKGSYQKIEPVKFPLGDVVIALSNVYLDLIRKELPNAEIGLIEEAASRPVPVKIRFDFGSGLLMPMRL